MRRNINAIEGINATGFSEESVPERFADVRN
jgi:hypothetical protein